MWGREVFDFNDQIISGTKVKPNTFAYPFGSGAGIYPKEIELQDSLKKYFIGARGVVQFYGPTDKELKYDFAKQEQDYFRLRIAAVSRGIDHFAGFLNGVKKSGGLITYMYHGIWDGYYDAIGEQEFIRQMDTLKSFESELWVAPLSSTIKYHREKQAAHLEVCKLETGFTITLTDTLRNQDFNQPLTVKVRELDVLSLLKGEKEIPFQKMDGYILFDLIPNEEKVVIKLK